MQVAGRSRSTDGAAGLGLTGCPGPRSAAAGSESREVAPGCVRPFPALGWPRVPLSAGPHRLRRVLGGVRGEVSGANRPSAALSAGWSRWAGSCLRAVGATRLASSDELRFGCWQRWWWWLCAFCLAWQQEVAFRGFFIRFIMICRSVLSYVDFLAYRECIGLERRAGARGADHNDYRALIGDHSFTLLLKSACLH